MKFTWEHVLSETQINFTFNATVFFYLSKTDPINKIKNHAKMWLRSRSDPIDPIKPWPSVKVQKM